MDLLPLIISLLSSLPICGTHSNNSNSLEFQHLALHCQPGIPLLYLSSLQNCGDWSTGKNTCCVHGRTWVWPPRTSMIMWHDHTRPELVSKGRQIPAGIADWVSVRFRERLSQGNMWGHKAEHPPPSSHLRAHGMCTQTYADTTASTHTPHTLISKVFLSANRGTLSPNNSSWFHTFPVNIMINKLNACWGWPGSLGLRKSSAMLGPATAIQASPPQGKPGYDSQSQAFK